MNIFSTRVPLISCPLRESPLINTLLQQGDHGLRLRMNRFSCFLPRWETAEEATALAELGKLVPGSPNHKQAAPGEIFYAARGWLMSFLYES